AESLLHVLNEILDFSKIDATEVKLNPTWFGPESLVHDAADLFKANSLMRGLALDVDCSGMPAGISRVCTDQELLRRVLLNLIGNAVKFTHAGEVKVTLRGEVLDLESMQVYIDVADTGIGIAPEAV